MFIPIGDDNSDRTIKPYVNYVFIGLNILVWVLFQQMDGGGIFTYAYSTVPAEIMTGQDLVLPMRDITVTSTGTQSDDASIYMKHLFLFISPCFRQCLCMVAGCTLAAICCIYGFLATILKTGWGIKDIFSFILFVVLLLHSVMCFHLLCRLLIQKYQALAHLVLYPVYWVLTL